MNILIHNTKDMKNHHAIMQKIALFSIGLSFFYILVIILFDYYYLSSFESKEKLIINLVFVCVMTALIWNIWSILVIRKERKKIKKCYRIIQSPTASLRKKEKAIDIILEREDLKEDILESILQQTNPGTDYNNKALEMLLELKNTKTNR